MLMPTASCQEVSEKVVNQVQQASRRTSPTGVMKPLSMSSGKGGSQLKGCRPVSRMREAFRHTQLHSREHADNVSKLLLQRHAGGPIICGSFALGHVSDERTHSRVVCASLHAQLLIKGRWTQA